MSNDIRQIAEELQLSEYLLLRYIKRNGDRSEAEIRDFIVNCLTTPFLNLFEKGLIKKSTTHPNAQQSYYHPTNSGHEVFELYRQRLGIVEI